MTDEEKYYQRNRWMVKLLHHNKLLNILGMSCQGMDIGDDFEGFRAVKGSVHHALHIPEH